MMTKSILRRSLALFLALIMCIGMLPVSALAEEAETQPPHEHSWEWTVVTPATCTSAGSQQRTCAGCGAVETASIAALPHSFGEWTVVTPATCTEAGVQQHVCSVCGTVETASIPVAAHSFGEWTIVTPATCTDAGVQKHVCTVCGAEETAAVDKLPHSFGEWQVTKEPTCTEKGVKVRRCENCDATETADIDVVPHTFGEWSVVTPATCSSEGLQKRTCSVCGEVEEEVIPALPHTFGDWTELKKATCSEEGLHEHTCLDCGTVVKEAIPALPHTFGEWTVLKEPTCAKEGKQEHTCEVCGEVVQEAIPTLPHTFGDWKVTKEPTCTKEGKQEHKCTVCGEVVKEKIPVLEHDLDEAGKCKDCGAVPGVYKPAQTLSASVGNLNVTVSVPAGRIPEGSKLVARAGGVSLGAAQAILGSDANQAYSVVLAYADKENKTVNPGKVSVTLSVISKDTGATFVPFRTVGGAVQLLGGESKSGVAYFTKSDNAAIGIIQIVRPVVEENLDIDDKAGEDDPDEKIELDGDDSSIINEDEKNGEVKPEDNKPEDIIKYKVTFILDGEEVESREIEADAALGVLPAVKDHEDAEFLGWFADEEAEPVTAETIVTADVTLTARFESTKKPVVLKEGSSLTAGAVSISGLLPEGGYVTASKVGGASSAKKMLRAAKDSASSGEITLGSFDITIFDENGDRWQPEKPVSVSISDPSFGDGKTLTVYHLDDSGSRDGFKATVVSRNNTITFSANHFSIYIVTEQGDDARLSVVFHKVDGSTTTQMITKNQIPQINMYIVEPEAGEPEGSIFTGWTTDENYDDSTTALTISGVREEVETRLNQGEVTDGETELHFYAMAFNTYKVTYLDERGIFVQIDQVRVRLNDTSTPTHNVTLDYTPYPPEQAGVSAQFLGWQQIQPEVPGDRVLYKPGDSFEFAEGENEYILRAYTETGHWLTFEENLSNATYTEPQFIAIGGKPTIPAEPTRTGYAFEGWFTEDDSAARDGKVSGDEFDFDQELTANTTVYGKWTAAQRADYNVVFWFQNKEGTGYDYSGTTLTVENATVGDNTYQIEARGGNGNDRYARVHYGTGYYDYDDYRAYYFDEFFGFHLNRFDDPKPIAAEGNTVINVYYDRNNITYIFKGAKETYTQSTGNNANYGIVGGQYTELTWYNRAWYYYSNGWQRYTGTRYIRSLEDLTFTGLYGSDFTEWPDPGTGSVWNIDGTTFPLPLTEFNPYAVDDDPGNTTVFTWTKTDHNTYHTLYVYKQTETGEWSYTNDYLIATAPLGEGTWTPSETYIGYTLDSYRIGQGGTWMNCTPSTRIEYGNNDLYLRYTRDQNDIVYSDGIFVAGDGDDEHPDTDPPAKRTGFETRDGVYYEANINTAEYNFKPSLSGYQFLGWYDNELCTGEKFTFDKMPAHNVTLYAKWGHCNYTVTLHPNDSTDDPIKYNKEDQAQQFWPAEGDRIGELGGTRIYYDLVGWYADEAMTKPFDFEAIVINRTNIGKYGRLYSESEIDPEYPSTVGELHLYAKWRSKLIGADGINIEYVDGEHGTGASAHDLNKYVDASHANAHSAFTPAEPSKYVFSHWEVQKWNGSGFVPSGVTVFPGDTFEVIAADAQITDAEGNVKTLDQLVENEEYTYLIQVKAVYVEKEQEIKTHITWFDNFGGTIRKDENLKINQTVTVPAAPTRAGYKFLGWIRGVEEDGNTTNLTELYITYNNGVYSATTVAADEYLVDASGNPDLSGTKHNAMYAKWEELEVTINYAVHSDSTGKGTVAPTSETVKAATGTPVGSTATVASSTYAFDYWTVDDGTESISTDEHFVPQKNSSGLYEQHTYYAHFKLNKAIVTVHHYLKGTTTKVADDVVTRENIGAQIDPANVPVATTFYDTYAGYSLTKDSTNPTTVVTVVAGGVEITLYYTLPLKITVQDKLNQPYTGATQKGYGTMVNDHVSFEGLLDGDVVSALNYTPAEGKVVGEYNGSFTADPTVRNGSGTVSYYVIEKHPGKLTIVASEKKLYVSSEQKSWPYDGETHTLQKYTVTFGDETIAGTEGQLTFTLSTGDTLTVVPTGKGATGVKNVSDSDANSFTWSVTNEANYTKGQDSTGRLSITPVAVTLTSETATKPYDGTPLTKPTVTVGGAGATVFQKEVSDIKATGSVTTVAEGEVTNTITYTEGENFKAENYSISKTEGTLKITALEVTVEVHGKTNTTGYTGSTQKVEGLYEDLIKISNPLYKRADFKLKEGEGKAEGKDVKLPYEGSIPGKYYMGLTASSFENLNSNFEVTFIVKDDGWLMIMPANLTITVKPQEYEYNGKPQGEDNATYTSGIADKVSTSGLKGTDTLTSITLNGQETNVGEYTEKIVASDADISSQPENYKITYLPGKLTITGLTVTAKVDDKTVTYNGETQYGNTEVKFTGLADGHTATITYKPSEGKDAKTYKNGAYIADSFKVVDSENKDVTSNYTLATLTPGNLTINQAIPKYETLKVSKVYDGTPLEGGVVLDGISEDEVTIQYSWTWPTQDGWSTTPSSVTDVTDGWVYYYTRVSGKNYSPNITWGALQITKAPLTITAIDQSYPYNGQPQGEDNATYTTGIDGKVRVEGLAATDTLKSITLNGQETSVGEYADKIEASAAEVTYGHKTDKTLITDNYKVTYVPGKLTITQAEIEVTITGHTGTFVFNGAQRTVTGYDVKMSPNNLGLTTDDLWHTTGNTVKDPVTGDMVPEVLRVTDDMKTFAVKGTAVNTYAMGLKATAFECRNPNYKVTFKVTDGSLTITPAPAGTITVVINGNTNTVTYNGLDQVVNGYNIAQIVAPNNAAEQYVRNRLNNVNVEATATGKDASTTRYPMNLTAGLFPAITYNGMNVQYVINDGWLLINPAPVTVTANDININVGETVPELTAKVTGLVNNEPETLITYTIDREPGEENGTYAITVTGEKQQGNYTVTFVPGRLTIDEAGPEPTPPVIEIVEPEPPLAGPTKAQPVWALLNLILGIITLIIGALMSISLIKKPKQDEDEKEAVRSNPDTEEEDKKRKWTKLLGLIPALAAVITFLLTEDMRNPMVFVDKWTILMAIYLIVGGLLAFFTRNKKDEEKEEEQAQA